MKLKKLIINNIASIEQAEIRFDETPLANEHLFLITGETGSGKSTIIDCICLALYGNTPRLKAARKDDYTTKRQDSETEESIKTDDVRQLLRRGAVSAEVNLTFDDNDGVPYVATWKVHRSRGKIEGNILKPERVIETDEGVAKHLQYTKKSDLDDFVKETIGLDMNEFFRTVVLAQGKFSEFLNSDENDKAALLEKMTGTEIYAQVGKKIYEVCREKQFERDELSKQLQDIKLLSEDEKEDINSEIENHAKEQAAKLKEGEGAKKMAQWLDTKTQNEQALDKKRQELTDKQMQTQKESFIEEQRMVADWDATIEPRRELKEQQLAQRQIQALMGKEPELQEDFDNLCAGLRATIKTLAAQQQKLDETETFLQQEAPNSKMYSAIKSIKALLKQRQGEQYNIDTFTQALEREQKRQPTVKEKVKTTQDAQQQQESLVKSLEKQYDSMDVNGINGKKDALTNAKQALSQHKAANDAVKQASAMLQSVNAELKKEQQTLETAKATLKDKRALKEKAHEAVERETDWNNLLQQAHKSLHQGDTCPVCGKVIDELLSPKGENVLQELRDQLKEAEKDLNATETSIAASDKAIKRLLQQKTDVEKDLSSKSSTRDKQWQHTQQLLALCGKVIDKMADNALADELTDALDQEIESLNKSLQEASTLLNRITTERNKSANLATEHNNAKIEFNQVIDSIKHQQDAIKVSKERYESFTQELNSLLIMDDWQQQIAVNQDDSIANLERNASVYQEKETLSRQLKESISVTNALIPAMEENKRNIDSLKDNGKDSDTIPSQLDKKWRQFENTYINWKNQLDNQRDKSEHAQQELDKYLAEHPTMNLERLTVLNGHLQDEINIIKQKQKTLADAITHMQGEISALTKRGEDINAQKPDYPIENREQLEQIYTACHSRHEELTSLIAELKAQLKTDEANMKAVGEKKKALDKAEAIYQQWADFSNKLGSADGKTFRKIAQSYILGELLHSANGYLRQFNDRYELEANPGTLIILVRDLLQGELTSVNTLSGGEGFMVSLALALALSSTTGKMFSVDTLFIDEGFGSLSEKYLDNVMETLNRLYDMGGRRVGIISHVKMLKERVPTQIQVERDPGNNTVSRIQVV